MTPEGIEDIYPLSGMQEALLYHGLQAGKGDMGFLQLRCSLRGPLDADALRRAWHATYERCDILRAGFTWEGLDQPLQVVHRTVEIPWSDQDCRELAAADQERRIIDLLAAERQAGFELDGVPLSRVILVRLAQDRHELLWSYHHLQLDGWSLPSVFGDIMELYAAGRSGRPAQLVRRRPFRDYIAWLQQQPPQAAELFWRRYLAGFAAPTPLSDHLPMAAPGRSGTVSERLHLDAALHAGIEALARSRQVTVNVVVQAALALVVAHRSGRNDVMVGSVVSGRPPHLPGVEDMVGTFINNLPVRFVIADQRLDAWLGELMERQLEAAEFAHLPLAQIEGWGEPVVRQRLFDTLVLVDNLPACDIAGELSVGDFRGNITSTFPLTLQVHTRPLLVLEVIFDASRFASEGVRAVLEDLGRVLSAMVAQPTAHLAALAAAIPAPAQAPLPARRLMPVAAPLDREAQIAPSIPLHYQIREIWRELLGVTDIAVNDNFFDLGGHSLLAGRMMGAVQRAIGRKLPMAALFPDATISGLARNVLEQIDEAPVEMVQVQAGGAGRRPFFYLHGDLLGGGYYAASLARCLGSDLPFYALPPCRVDGQPITPSVEEMAARHIAAIRRISPSGPYRIGGFCLGGVVAYEVARQLEEQGEQVELLAIIDALVDPLWRRYRAITGFAGRLLRQGHDRQLQRFSTWNIRVERLRDLARSGLRAKLQFLRRKVAGSIPGGQVPERRSSGLSARANMGGRDLMSAHVWAAAGYQPKPFHGRLDLFMSDEMSQLGGVEYRMWGGLVADLVVHRTPGQHLEAITRNVEMLAEKLRACLERTPPAPRAPSEMPLVRGTGRPMAEKP